MMVEKDRKATLQAIHTDAVNKAVNSHERNVVLDRRPPPISNSEKRPNEEGTLNPRSTTNKSDPDIVDSWDPTSAESIIYLVRSRFYDMFYRFWSYTIF